MSKLYFGVCPYGTIADVFINTLAGWSEDWVQPCTPEINATGHLIHRNHEQYVLDLTDNKPMTFRDIDWTDRLGDIEALLNGVGDRKVWIGNFHNKQAQVIKKHFGDNVTTVGLSYNPRSRDLILENVLTYYGISSATSKEEYNVKMNVRYYSDKEKWDKKVPYNFEPDTDVSIDVSTFFTPNNYISELEQLDGPRNAKQLEYYFTWLYRTKERVNESF
jgi:hypothetical protein